MADPADRTHAETFGGDGSAQVEPSSPAPAEREAALVRPGDPATAAYPVSEAEYWRDAYSREPYYECGRRFEDYGTAYELGWVGSNSYGGEFDIAERVLANDWLVRKGISTLSWEQARPAVRASWQRAQNTRSYVSDGSATEQQALETAKVLCESSRDGELGFRDAARHANTPELVALFESLAQCCAESAALWQAEIAHRGGTADESGTVSGAAHRAWLHIRSLFGGATDAALLAECERGLDSLSQCYREALQRNLPAELHLTAQRQFEEAERHHDHIRRLRERSSAEPKAAPNNTRDAGAGGSARRAGAARAAEGRAVLHAIAVVRHPALMCRPNFKSRRRKHRRFILSVFSQDKENARWHHTTMTKNQRQQGRWSSDQQGQRASRASAARVMAASPAAVGARAARSKAADHRTMASAVVNSARNRAATAVMAAEREPRLWPRQQRLRLGPGQ